MSKKRKLTDKQERFCLEYVVDSNATQAAIRAVYSKKTSQQQSTRLLLNVLVSKKILELQNATAIKQGIKREDVIKDIKEMAEIHRQLRVLTLKDKLTSEEESKFARLLMVTKGSDANKANEMLARMLGFNEPDKVDVQHKGIIFNLIEPDEDGE
jgi:phage terminase small subunit